MLFRIQPSGRLNSSHLIDQGYRFGTDQANEQTYVVPANKRTMALAGVPSDKDYSVQVLAYRNVDNDIDPSGIIQSATTTPMAGQHIPSRNVSFNGYVAGQPASTIAATAFNFNTRNDRDRSLIVDPVVATDGTAVDHVLNTDGSVDISFEWDWGGVDSSIDGWTIYVRSASVGGAYTFGAAKAEEQAYSLPADRRAIILPGVPANKYYTFFVQAYRIVDPDIAPNGLIVSAVVKSSRGEENPYQPQANVAFLGDIGGTINGTAVATLMTNVEQGTTAYLNTTEYRKSGPPSTNPTATGAVITSNSNGSRNIRLNWSAYTQGTNKADLLLIFWRKASTTPTVNDSAVNVNVNTTGTSYYIFEGVSPADVYSFGIAAARKSESGLEIGPIQTHASWTNLATTVPDFTGTVGGEDATQVAANAMNPAAQINAASTTIDPGKIKISGAVTLDNWRTTNSTTIDGGKITTGSVTADQIAAGSITATKVNIGDTSNMFGDPNMADTAYYQGSFTIFSTTNVNAAPNRLRTISSALEQIVTTGWTNVERDKPYYFSCMAYVETGTSTVRVQVEWYTATNGTLIRTDEVGTSTLNTTTPRIAGTFVAPSNARAVRFKWVKDASAAATEGSFGEPVIRRAANGELIVDGAIGASKIAAGAVSAGKMTVVAGGNIAENQLPNGMFIGTTGDTIGTVQTEASTAFDGTTAYRTSGVPTNNPTPTTTVGIVANTNGTRNVTLNWAAYTQGARKADFIMIFWKRAATAPTINDSSVAVNVNTAASYYIFEGIDPSTAISFGIAAARRTENGLEIGAIQTISQWTNLATATANFTGNIAGTAAATIRANALDPATVINSAATNIDPGKITIQGATTLADWRTPNTTTIDGGKITAFSIKAAQIEAGAITASKIVIGDSSNIVDNGWSAGSYDGWSVAGFLNWSLDGIEQGSAAGWRVASNARDQVTSQTISVTPGETYYLSAWVNNNDANVAQIMVFQNADRSLQNTSAFSVASTNDKGVWRRLEGQYTVPTGITALRMLLQSDRSSTGGNPTYWSKPVMRRATSGELVVNGAITGNKIAANSISAGHVEAGAITASKMAIRGENLFPDPQCQDIGWWKGPSQGTFSEPGRVVPVNNSNLGAGGWILSTNGLSGYADRVGGSKGMWQLWSDGGYTGTELTQVITPSMMAKAKTYYEISIGCTNSSNRVLTLYAQAFTNAGVALATTGLFSFAAGDSTTIIQRTKYQIPVNATSFRLFWETPASSAAFSGFINVGNISIREAASGTMIVDGSIEAGHIKANTITGNEIKSDAALPATLTIGATGFKLGTVNTAVSQASGGNQAVNTEFDAGMNSGYGVVAKSPASIAVNVYKSTAVNRNIIKAEWTSVDTSTVVSLGMVDPAVYVQVTAGDRIAYSCGIEGQGAVGSVQLSCRFRNASGTIVSTHTAITSGGKSLGFTLGDFVTVPAGATTAQLELYTFGSGAGSVTQVFLHPMISVVTNATTVLPPYSQGTMLGATIGHAINSNTTQIDPGRITISGGTTLANWRNGSNTTQIEGGAIAANTITANKLTIGARGVQFIGITFDTNRSNQVSWSSGSAVYLNDAGNWVSVGINAGSANHTAGTTLYIWWNKGSNILNAGQNPINNIDDMQLAQYWGGTNLYVTFGRTIIDGDIIKTGTVHANRIQAGTISAEQIGAGQITTNKLKVISSGLCPDPNFVDTTGFWGRDWNAGGWYAEESTNGSAQARYAALWSGNPNGNPGTTRKHIWSQYVESPGANQPLRLRATIANNCNQSIKVQVNFLNSSDGNIASYVLTSTALSGLLQYSTQLSVPDNARKLGFVIYNEGNNTFNGSAVVSGVQLDVAANAELIVDGAINADKLAANAVTAAKISAGSITASKLTLNGDNLWPDPQCQDINWWKGPSWGTISDSGYVNPANANNADATGWKLYPNNGHLSYRTAGSRGMWQLWSDGGFTSTAITQVVPPAIMVKQNATYQFSVGVWNQSNKRVRFVCQEFTHEGINNRATELFAVPAGNTATRLWDTRIKMQDATASARIYFEVENGDAFNGFANVGNFTFREAATANMIVDGVISANHVATGSITANKMTLGARPFSVRGMNMRVDTDGIMRWDGGRLQYMGDNGNYNYVDIPAGSAGYSGSVLYFVYSLGRPNLDWNTDESLSTSLNSFHLATWSGGANLEVKSGVGTQINGGKIVTGSINADRIQSNTALPASLTISGTGFSLGTINNALANATPYDSYNGSFTAWSGQIPDGFIGWTGNGTWAKVAGMNGKNSIRITASANGSNGIQQTGDGATGAANWQLYTGRYVVITADITLNSGTLEGAGILLRASGGNDVTLKFAVDPDTGGYVAGNGNVNQTYSFRKVVRTGAGGNGRQEMYLMNHWTGIGAISTANDITWHNAGWRYATEAEINPAKYINQNSTQIDPGKIVISGTTSLANWRNGSNTTQIEGGAIAANTISANKLSIGNRNIGFIGLNFEWNPSLNRVEWSNGYIYWQNDSNVTVGTFIAAGNTGSAAAHQFIYWNKGEGGLNYTQTESLMLSDNSVQIATWWGGDNLNVNYGGTIIHGNRITTGTLNADRIVAGSITGDRIYSNAQLPASLTIGNTGFNLSSVENNARRQSGGNFMRNTDFEGNGVSGWGILYNPSNVSQSMTFDTYQNRRYMKIIGQMTGADQVISIGAVDSDVFGRVYGGTRIAFSVKTETQNAIKSVYLVARFRDGGNNIVGQLATAVVNGALPWGYQLGGFGDVPAGAVTVQLELYATSSTNGWLGMVLSEPMVSEVTASTTVLPAYSNGVTASKSLASAINANTTQIDPGKITISGGTTLANWRNGSNTTQIEGGAIAANTITANKLKIGNRNLNFPDLSFQVINGGATLRWDSFYVQWIDVNGNAQQVSIAAGSVSPGEGFWYIHWWEGNNSIGWTVDSSYATRQDVVCIATWLKGTTRVIQNYGATIIDGDRITTGTIAADKLSVTNLSAITANVGTLTAGVIQNSNGSSKFDISSGRIIFNNGTVMKVSGTGFGSANQFIEWFGPALSNVNQCSESNATSYLKIDGSAYFGGALLAGTLRNTNMTSILANNASAPVGPFGSNGGQIVVNASWSWDSTDTGQYAATAQGVNNYNAAISNLRSNGYTITDGGSGGRDHNGYKYDNRDGNAFALSITKSGGTVATEGGCNGYISLVGIRPEPADGQPGWIKYTYTYSKSITYTDPERSTTQRNFAATIVRNFTPSGTGNQRVGINTVE